mmetsp:Transcript_75547/g.200884  ORF Transcript_75547/g.200884 Transcript_75547/m.200884 type:complete len:294 (-) Transcript_75547:93-974(-)
MDRHALAGDAQHLPGAAHAVVGDGHRVAVEMADLLFEPEQRLLERNRQRHRQVVAAPPEDSMRVGLQPQHDVAGYVPRGLLARPLENDLLTIRHALLDRGGEVGDLLLALLLGGNFLLLIDDHHPHPPLHHLDRGGAGRPAHVAAVVEFPVALPPVAHRLTAAAAADDSPSHLGAHAPAFVHVLEVHVYRHLHVVSSRHAHPATPWVCLARAALRDGTHAAGIVQRALLAIAEHLISGRDLLESVWVTALVRVVLQRELSVGALDDAVRRSLVDTQNVIQVSNVLLRGCCERQ